MDSIKPLNPSSVARDSSHPVWRVVAALDLDGQVALTLREIWGLDRERAMRGCGPAFHETIQRHSAVLATTCGRGGSKRSMRNGTGRRGSNGKFVVGKPLECR